MRASETLVSENDNLTFEAAKQFLRAVLKHIKFLKSSAKVEQCPDNRKPEFAFIGRSNVGKSSLINSMANYKKLAAVSGKPGKTQLINHFEVEDKWYLVDLPGYGYAKVSKKDRKKFQEMVSRYLLERENLTCVFHLIDSRRDEPQQSDLEFMQFLGSNGIPFIIVFTKSDKLKPKQIEEVPEIYWNALKDTWGEMPEYLFTSTVDVDGTDSLEKRILAILKDLN